MDDPNLASLRAHPKVRIVVAGKDSLSVAFTDDSRLEEMHLFGDMETAAAEVLVELEASDGADAMDGCDG